MRRLLQFILKIFARLTLLKYRPLVIGITGSVGKTSTKEAIAAVLQQRFNLRQASKSFNNEIGLPLTILGASESGYRNPFKWLMIFIPALWQLGFRNKDYPNYLVLEMGVDHKGDMDYLLSFIKPKVGVLTAVAEEHLEFFGSLEAVLAEESRLIKSLPHDGVAVLNYEDQYVKTLLDKTKARVITYGFSPETQVWADSIQMSKDEVGEIRGLSFKLHYGGSTTPLLLPGVLGKHQINIALAACAVGVALGLTPVDASAALRNFIFPPGRMRLLPGIKNTYLIDDTYNSSPLALREAIKTLAQFSLKGQSHRWAVLGDMLELGVDSGKLHRQCGMEIANQGIDYLVTVGERSRDFGRGAGDRGFDFDHCFHFANAQEAAAFIKKRVESGDVLLIKGSQGIRMERCTKELMAEPQKAGELLVRQNKPWI